MAYDIEEAFERIEEELISSMIRNMDRHRVKEIEEDLQWTQWQALQLQALAEYRQKNPKKFKKKFGSINKHMDAAIRKAYEDGQTETEAQILEAIKSGKLKLDKDPQGIMGKFFLINDSKLDALLNSVQNDMNKAEYSVLRRANDRYRQIIFDAQVYANTGAGTYEKAVDMATHDFLARGIDCIEYSNGARHTISDYAAMAIRTASKRAKLMGAAKKRDEWGINTIIVNKRSNPCPKCAKWVGRILIDDVYSSVKTPADHKYPLLSTAIREGFLHPNCKDGYNTYFPGVTDAGETISKPEFEEMVSDYVGDQQLRIAQNNADKFQRLADGSLDSNNKARAQELADRWSEKTLSSTYFENIEEVQNFAQQFIEPKFGDKTFKGVADLKGISIENANEICRALAQTFEQFPEMEKLSGIKCVSPNSKIGQKAFKDGADALFSYDPINHGIYINKDVLKDAETFEAYKQRSKDAWDLVMNNLDKVSPVQKELALRYSEAGRSLVDDSIGGALTHELGHHVQWTMLDTGTFNSVASRASQYAPHISGYATSSTSEYMAESFVAYMRGERDILDPAYAKYLDQKIKVYDKIPTRQNAEIEFVEGFSLKNPANIVNDMREEYELWVDSLDSVEIHGIRKYMKNDFDDERPKFYERLNAMLRGDTPEDPALREYADIISGALKRQPLENDIICYRTCDVNPFAEFVEGDVVTINQFLSSSVTKGGTLDNKQYEITILAVKGTKGAYIETLATDDTIRRQREFLFDKDCQFVVLLQEENRTVVGVFL